MTISPKKAASNFKKQYAVNSITEKVLVDTLSSQGYTVIYFNAVYNEPDVANLIGALNLEGYVAYQKGFIYSNDKYRLVFVNEDLSEEEKVLVLSHEEGHVFCGHCSEQPIIGKDVIEEHEANEFSHYLLNPSSLEKVKYSIKKHRKIFIALLTCVLIAAIGITAFTIVTKEKSYYGEYYITSTGSKYHRKDCIFVKNKNDVYRMTKEEFESGEYEACKTCLP